MNSQQLTLGFGLRDDATFASFFPGNNLQIQNAVLNWVHGKGDSFLYIYGAQDAGKSHILQAACHAAAELLRSAAYLPLPAAKLLGSELANDVFVGLENVELLCIDDLDNIVSNKLWEENLFHLFNRIRSNGNRLLIAATAPPLNLPIHLPDLQSRLAWGVIYQLHTLDDEQKLAALQLRAQSRGLELEPAVGRFLLRRCPRNMGLLFATLEKLDQASLAEQRRLTIPFVKDVLGV